MKTIIIIALTLSISTGLAWSHPVYDERGHIVGETLEDHGGMVDLSPLGHLESDSVIIIPDDITALLRECLEFIQDGSVDQGRELNTLVYRPITRDGVAQDEADRAAYEAERYRRETELHRRIVEMIKKLEPKEKKK